MPKAIHANWVSFRGRDDPADRNIIQHAQSVRIDIQKDIVQVHLERPPGTVVIIEPSSLQEHETLSDALTACGIKDK